MPKLRYRNEWFYELAPTALYESEFEDILIQNADIICSSSIIVPFKMTVSSNDGSARADLAIISEDYRDWYVVEVELIKHSLHGHVIPQIRVFRDASYGQEVAEYLATKNSKLGLEKLADMMRGQQPRVLVIVDKTDPEWERELRRYDVFLIVFEIYRSDRNHYMFRIDGDLSPLALDVLTYCEFDAVVPRFLVVSSPAALDFSAGKRVKIFVEGQVTEWERIDIADQCYLTPVGRMPIEPGRKYALVKTGDGEYLIRAAQ